MTQTFYQIFHFLSWIKPIYFEFYLSLPSSNKTLSKFGAGLVLGYEN